MENTLLKSHIALDALLFVTTLILSIGIAVWVSTLTDNELAAHLLALTTSYTVGSFLFTFVCTPISDAYRDRRHRS